MLYDFFIDVLKNLSIIYLDFSLRVDLFKIYEKEMGVNG